MNLVELQKFISELSYTNFPVLNIKTEEQEMYAGGPGSGRHKESIDNINSRVVGMKIPLWDKYTEVSSRSGSGCNRGMCHSNAIDNTKKDSSLKVVAGVTIDKSQLGGEGKIRPSVHVWNVDSKNRVVDTTYGTKQASQKIYYGKETSLRSVDAIDNWIWKQREKATGRKATVDDLEFGGAGSGRHPYGRKDKDEGKAKRALDSYVPMTKATLDRATANEKALVAALPGSKHLGDHQPFDIVHPGKRIGIEVKTKMAGRSDRITMHPASLMRKLKAAKSMKLSQVATVIFDDRHGRIYYAMQLGSFKWNRKDITDSSYRGALKEVKSVKDLRKVFGI